MNTGKTLQDADRTPTVRLNPKRHEAGSQRAMRSATTNVLEALDRCGGTANSADLARQLCTSRRVVEAVLREQIEAGRVSRAAYGAYRLH